MHFPNLDDVLSPLPASEFIRDYLGQKFVHLPGSRGRFSSLFPWPVLNEMLDTHRFVSPRLRLSQDGKTVSPDLFMKNGQLRSAELTGLLREGATLIVDAVDEVHPPLKDFAQHLSRKLQARINVNLYAGWRTSHGFDTHWDSHDVFILQVAGKKQWKIYAPTEKYPVKNSVELGRTPPTCDPVWDDFLTDGEVLYLPRGWWHVAIPCNEPTLHLTVGIYEPTGIDMLRWVTEGLQSDERIRMDLPVLGDAARQAAYMTAIQQSIREAFEQPNLLPRFTQHWNDTAIARPSFSLPWSATPEVLPASEDSIIKLLAPRDLEMRSREDGAIDLAFNGNVFTFAGAAKPLFSFFAEELPASITEFYQRFADQFERGTMRDFLIVMAKHGVIAVHEPVSAPAESTKQANV
jgi:ribosomal protein L16 Arg81 hydroxylase